MRDWRPLVAIEKLQGAPLSSAQSRKKPFSGPWAQGQLTPSTPQLPHKRSSSISVAKTSVRHDSQWSFPKPSWASKGPIRLDPFPRRPQASSELGDHSWLLQGQQPSLGFPPGLLLFSSIKEIAVQSTVLRKAHLLGISGPCCRTPHSGHCPDTAAGP